MTISSRTPEGLPHLCPVCGKPCALEPSYPGGDSCCPTCGHLLWWFRDRLAVTAGADPVRVTVDSALFEDFGADSLDAVELVMELEKEFDVAVAPDDLRRCKTVADAIRFIQERRARGDAA